MKYEIWVYQGMNVLNFSGIHNSEHQGTCMGTMEEFLDRTYPNSGWRMKYTTCVGGTPYRQGLRSMFQDFRIQMWLEMEFGSSYRGYRTLDAYVSMYYAGMFPPPTSVWYLLNQSKPVYARHLYMYQCIKGSTCQCISASMYRIPGGHGILPPG